MIAGLDALSTSASISDDSDDGSSFSPTESSDASDDESQSCVDDESFTSLLASVENRNIRRAVTPRGQGLAEDKLPAISSSKLWQRRRDRGKVFPVCKLF